MIWAALRSIDGLRFVGAFGMRTAIPLYRFAKKIIKTFFLGTILNVYFFVLKLKRKVRTLALAGSHKLLSWLNTYVFKLTILTIIIITILNSLFTTTLNAEELRSHIIFSAIVDGNNDTAVNVVQEGPLQQTGSQNPLSYLSDETLIAGDSTEITGAPDTDTDSLYTTTEDESAIISPIINTGSPDHPNRGNKIETYLVEAGDTISSISQKFGVNMNTILWQNNLGLNSTIRPGQSLSILSVDGVAHTVKSGENISQIAKKYQVEPNKIIEQNKLADASDLRVNETLIIPDGIKPTTLVVRPREPRNLPSVLHDIFVPPASPSQESGGLFLWPVLSHRITQYFTLRHSGLDIGDKKGTPIYAAESGRVEHASWTSGYGYNIIINHGNGIKTLYGHSSQLLVKAGDTVVRGQTIALVGSTGRSTGPHLHFEVRVSNRLTNPLNYIR